MSEGISIQRCPECGKELEVFHPASAPFLFDEVIFSL
jgi:rRNA maturation protein Nop10